MARYEHLPIYKAALDVAVGFEKLVVGFSRYHKYTLGSELRNGSRRVLEQVVRANGARERLPELLVLHERLDSLLLTMRLAMEVRAFKGFKAYAHMVEQVSSVCRQNEGWIKSTEKR
ncbi:MAG TPA: four helix bundle protein [Accumulibacter sp.]|nr:four helix bundle protein [Accumulibacter sp.]